MSVTRKVDGSNTTVWGNDNTRKGAVMCNWGIEVEGRAMLELCPQAHVSELREHVDRNIASIDAFIVANSPQPTTLNQLHDQEEQKYTQARQRVNQDPDGSAMICTKGDVAKMIAYFNDMSRAQRQQSVEDLLSVPRWPVMNPCL